MGDEGQDSIGSVAKAGATALGILDIVKILIFLIVLSIILIFFVMNGLPWFIVPVILGLVMLVLVLKIASVKRISEARLDEKPVENIPAHPDFGSDKITAAVVGLMKAGGSVRGVEILGAGKIRNPENALIVTDRNLIFLYVPILGGDRTIAGADTGMMNWLFAKGAIEKKLREMLAAMSLNSIFESCQGFHIPLGSLAKFERGGIKQGIAFVTKDGKKYSYSIRDKGDIERLGKIFSSYSGK